MLFYSAMLCYHMIGFLCVCAVLKLPTPISVPSKTQHFKLGLRPKKSGEPLP